MTGGDRWFPCGLGIGRKHGGLKGRQEKTAYVLTLIQYTKTHM